jgi:hypothetical protein
VTLNKGDFSHDDSSFYEDFRPNMKRYKTMRKAKLQRGRALTKNKATHLNYKLKDINKAIEEDEDVENIERYEREEYDELIANAFIYLTKGNQEEKVRFRERSKLMK